jgi:glycosyltransferase involved in cell wall biosynthesis
MQPLLSICIPTWNRADLLRDFLLSLSQHITPYLDQVEIVISDNASTDHTQDIIASSGLPITHGKQSSTVGFTKNVLSVTTELARGEFIWVVGDDDLILPSAIATILDSITKHPELDYHYLNFGWINAKKKGRNYS